MLRWAVEIGRLDVLYETEIMSKHMAMPRQGHLEQVLHIFGYIKAKKKLRIAFDPDYPQISEYHNYIFFILTFIFNQIF